MKQSTFKKEITVTGIHNTVKGYVLVTMNYQQQIVTGTNSITHDDFQTTQSIHKVEVYINHTLWKSKQKINSEADVLKESEKLIREATERITYLSNTKTEKTFEEKMNELFS